VISKELRPSHGKKSAKDAKIRRKRASAVTAGGEKTLKCGAAIAAR
jgi:hypothetical protein